LEFINAERLVKFHHRFVDFFFLFVLFLIKAFIRF